MDSAFNILLAINNYSHDIATAFLAVSGFMLWVLSRHYPESDDKAIIFHFITLYNSIKTIAKYSLIWILIAGVFRVTFYNQFEWSDTAGDMQVVVIGIKHVVMFLIVGIGITHWLRLDKKVKILKIKIERYN